MDFLIFITLIALSIIFAVFGLRYYSFVILSGLILIILGAYLLTNELTITKYFAVWNYTANTTQIVNVTTPLLSPPWSFLLPILLIFSGATEIGVNLRGGKGGGFVYG